MDRHRITGASSDAALVVQGKGDELLVLDYLSPEDARKWHYKLLEQHEPHMWQVYSGARTGWNSVSGYFIATDASRLVTA